MGQESMRQWTRGTVWIREDAREEWHGLERVSSSAAWVRCAGVRCRLRRVCEGIQLAGMAWAYRGWEMCLQVGETWGLPCWLPHCLSGEASSEGCQWRSCDHGVQNSYQVPR